MLTRFWSKILINVVYFNHHIWVVEQIDLGVGGANYDVKRVTELCDRDRAFIIASIIMVVITIFRLISLEFIFI